MQINALSIKLKRTSKGTTCKLVELTRYRKKMLTLFTLTFPKWRIECHHADTICHTNSSYVTTKLYETSTCGCNNNTIFQNELFSRFLPSTYVAWQRRSLGDAAKVAIWRHGWIQKISCLKFRFCITTVSNIMIIIIVKWCSGIACDWCASLDISSILALRVHCSTFFIYLVLCRVSVYCRVYDLGLRS